MTSLKPALSIAMAWQEADAPVHLSNSTGLRRMSAMWQPYPRACRTWGQPSRLAVSQGLGNGIGICQCL